MEDLSAAVVSWRNQRAWESERSCKHDICVENNVYYTTIFCGGSVPSFLSLFVPEK